MQDQPLTAPKPEVERPAPAPEVPRPPEAPEARREAPAERPREAPAPSPEAERPSAAPAVPAAPAAPAPIKDPMTIKVEKILEEGLGGLFASMKPDVQRVFKTKGEETASKIRALLSRTAVKAKDILKLIRDWLTIIPGVNRFFLEQEAKIKTDKIMSLKKE